MNDYEPEATWADVLSLLDWLREQTAKTQQATKDFSDTMWLKKEIEQVEIEMAQK